MTGEEIKFPKTERLRFSGIQRRRGNSADKQAAVVRILERPLLRLRHDLIEDSTER